MLWVNGPTWHVNCVFPVSYEYVLARPKHFQCQPKSNNLNKQQAWELILFLHLKGQLEKYLFRFGPTSQFPYIEILQPQIS